MRLLIIILCGLMLMSCKKYLDASPNKQIYDPTTLADLQLLLDNNNIINSSNGYTSEILSDNYYVPSTTLSSVSDERQRRNYTWERGEALDWNEIYIPVFYANTVLEKLQNLKPESKEQSLYNNVKGSALFIRGFYFFMASELYSQPYNKNTAKNELGIVLRLQTNINVKNEGRSTVEETFSRIISDLKEASSLLSDTSTYKTRPSKAAAFGALARVYLSMNIFDSALVYSSKALNIYSKLLDYNTLDPFSLTPFEKFNKEIIFHSKSSQPAEILLPFIAKLDSNLVNSYEAEDLRRTFFLSDNYDGTFAFKGAYNDDGPFLSGFVSPGIVTDELYLIFAECLARAGRLTEAENALKTLLQNRYTTGQLNLPNYTSSQLLIDRIIQERQKELIYRGLRWYDIRRLKDDQNFAIKPVRVVDNTTYTLMSDNKKLVRQIPNEVIIKSGIQQN